MRSSQAHLFLLQEHRPIFSPSGEFFWLLSVRGPTLGCKPRETVWPRAFVISGLLQSGCSGPRGDTGLE